MPKNKILISIFLVSVILIWAKPTEAQSFNYGTPRDNVFGIYPTSLNLLEKITEAKQLLAHSPALTVEQKKLSRNKKQVVRKQISLAVLNTTTNEVSEHRYWVNEADIKAYVKTARINIVPVNDSETLPMTVRWWNSFNSYYEITDHPELLVIANKYPLLSKNVPDPKQRSDNGYTDIVYVPYSDSLKTPELIQAGKNYIDSVVNAAFTSLQDSAVPSRSVSGQLVTDVVSKEFLKNIILVEHVDPEAFALADDRGKLLTDRVLTILGSNQEAAYAYTGSPAGANGIAQFISSTYRTMRLTYPTAKLIPDFLLGTATHENAIKAMALFFDAYKAEIQNKIVNKDILTQLGGVSEEMLSAAYNGGPNRVVRSVNNYGSNWLNGQLTASVTKVFRRETLAYLNKFQAIRDLHLF